MGHGFKSPAAGKVVWITALMPYVIIIILLIRGVLLEGAAEGVRFYLEPDLSRLSKTEVSHSWVTEVKLMRLLTRLGSVTHTPDL